MRDQARVVIIGGGVFGTSVAYHLARFGCRDVVLVDKGELTSGSTFHSVGLVSQFRSSPALMKVMNYTINLFNELNKEAGDGLGWHQVGSLRLASSPDRLKALQREAGRARGIGLTVRVIGPEEVLALAPFVSPESLYGAVYIPEDGHIDPSAITYELARQAKKLGVEIVTNCRVTAIDRTAKGQITGVQTERGPIRTEVVVNAAGEWAARIGEMVGVKIPVIPLMHQYLCNKPIPGHELPRATPVVRDPDNMFYVREDVGGFLIGAFEPNPKDWAVDGPPWEFTQQLLSPEWELFEPILERAIGRIPLLAEAEFTRLVNGPDGFTPDGAYALGPWPGLKGFFLAAGGSINGIAGAGGVGKLVAEWILYGEPSLDVYEMNCRRFSPHQARTEWLSARAREVYRYYYALRYPEDENEFGRPFRLTPCFDRLQELGAVFGEKNGWERALYFQPGQPGRRAGAEQHKWGYAHPPYAGLVAEEVAAARNEVALFDMTSYGKMDLTGPGSLALLQRLACNDVAVPPGTVVYTQFLNRQGGIESDLTVTRLAEEHFRLVTGTAYLGNDSGWITMHLPADGSAVLTDVTDAYGCLGLWGPKAREVLSRVTTVDLSNAAFPYMTAQMIDVAGVRLLAQRISYVGELGWELYPEAKDGLRIYDALLAAGRPLGLRPAGYKAVDSLRLEKGYLYWGADMTPSDNPWEAGLGFLVKLSKGDFIGREALVNLQARGPAKRLRAVLLDRSAVIYGGEAIWDKERVVDRIRSGGPAHTLGKTVGLAYLPLELARPGARLEVEVFGQRLPAEVGPARLYDPQGEKLKV